MDWEDLPGLFPSFERPEEWLPLLQRHSQLLEEAAPHTRVTAVHAEDAVQRHFAESLEIWRLCLELVPNGASLVVDVGSGGGFPGIVMACIARETRFALVEPLQKRARLLAEVTRTMGLTNVDVFGLRAEEAGRGPLREQADLVTARAVAPLSELLEYTAPLAKVGGLIALPKGSALAEEIESARKAMHMLGCEHDRTLPMSPVVSETLSVAMFRKRAATHKTYPRRPGMPRQRPL